MTPALLHIYETWCCLNALSGSKRTTLTVLSRACGLREWECYCRVVGLRRRGLAPISISGLVA